MYLAGNQGESLANESVEAVQHIVENTPAPDGVKAFVTGPSAMAADQQIAGDRSLQMITMLTFAVIIVMLLLVYRSIITVILVLVMVAFELTAAAAWSRSSATTRSSGSRRLRSISRAAGDRRRHGLRDISHRPISGGARGR